MKTCTRRYVKTTTEPHNEEEDMNTTERGRRRRNDHHHGLFLRYFCSLFLREKEGDRFRQLYFESTHLSERVFRSATQIDVIFAVREF